VFAMLPRLCSHAILNKFLSANQSGTHFQPPAKPRKQITENPNKV
jgi:hypothetical protein